MQQLRSIFYAYRTFFLSIAFAVLFSCGVSLAAPLYTPGQTLDPTCAPGTTDCTVKVSPWDTSGSNISFTTGNVGVGTASPAALFSVGSSSQFQVTSGGAVIAPTFNGVTLTTGGGTTTFLNADGTYSTPAGGGSGTVTSVSVVTANGVSGSVATNTTTPAITLTLGAITPTSVNGNTITTGSGILTLAAGKTFTSSNTLTLAGIDGSALDVGTGGTLGTAAYTASSLYGLVASPLSQFAATTSSQLAGVVSDETGTGLAVFSAAPVLASPVIANVAPGADFTLTQNSVAPFTSVNLGAAANTLVLNAGSVGIGTAAPVGKFHVVADSAYADATIAALSFGNLTSPLKKVYGGYDTAVDAGFLQAVDYGTGYKNLVLNPNGGNVGVGTTTPQASLDVANTAGGSLLSARNSSTGSVELIASQADRDFSGANNWTGTNWAISGGTFQHTTGSTAAATLPNANLTASSIISGRQYVVTLTVSNHTAGSLNLSLGGGQKIAFGTTYNGVGTVLMTAAANNVNLTIVPQTNFDGAFTNVSVKAVVPSFSVANNGSVYINSNANTLLSNAVSTVDSRSVLSVTRSPMGQGTITVTASGTTVAGVNTNFFTDFNVGETITANGETHTIATITSNSAMTTDAWTSAFTGTYTNSLPTNAPFKVDGNGKTSLTRLSIGSVQTAASWTTTGLQLSVLGISLTNASATGTVATQVANSFGAPSFSSTNSITVTDGATVYIAGAPTASTNTTITNPLALYVAAGNASFGGKVGIGTTSPTNALSLSNGTAQKFWIENTATDVVGRALTVAAGGTVAGTSASNVTGGNLILQSGLGTGTGASTISFQTGTTLTTGMTLQTMSTKMTILGNGNVGIGTTSPQAPLDIEGDGAILAGGSINSGTAVPSLGSTTRLMWYPSKSAFRAGTAGLTTWDAANVGYNSTAFGNNTTASGSVSSAFGNTTVASGTDSASFGVSTTASGIYSTAFGDTTTASGTSTTAFGTSTIAASYNSIVLGRFNVGGGSAGTWVTTDSLFEVGIGTATGASSADALVVLKNGNVGINLGANTNNPAYNLQVGNSGVSGIVARFQNSAGTCDINPNTSSLVCPSDMRLKKNITTLANNSTWSLNGSITFDNQSVLSKILALTPVSYNWKSESDSDTKHPGLIAQEVLQVFPDLVATDPATGLLSMNYTGLIPYTVQAIQEMNLNITDIANLDRPNTWRESLIAWLGSATNGITKIFSTQITTPTLCVGTDTDKTCITKNQLDHLLQQQGTGGGGGVVQEENDDDGDAGNTQTEEVTPPDVDSPAQDDGSQGDAPDDTPPTQEDPAPAQ